MMAAVVKIEARHKSRVRRGKELGSYRIAVYSIMSWSGLVVSTLQVHRTHFRRQSAWQLSPSKPGLSFDKMPSIATVM